MRTRDRTEVKVLRLRHLWATRLPTAEIGRRLRVSKNAVLGKAHRLGLAPRPSPLPPAAAVRRAAAEAARAPAEARR